MHIKYNHNILTKFCRNNKSLDKSNRYFIRWPFPAFTDLSVINSEPFAKLSAELINKMPGRMISTHPAGY
ncbi:hypothetical protein D0T08_09420 [Emticicia sp. C21]|nr:hypothetical protein D0T08_09420 [Emticicia sp. C21]